MKNLNEQLNIDLKNGTWSISTSDDNLVAGTPVSKTGYEDYTTDEVETSVEPTTTTSNTSSDEEYGQRRLDSMQDIPKMNPKNPFPLDNDKVDQ